MKITKSKIEELIKENAKFSKVELAEINIEESDTVFYIDLSDIDSNIVRDYIIKNNVISENDLDNQICEIIEKFN